MFYGSIPAVITPFKDQEVDYNSFSKIIEFLINNGSEGLVPCGTTGESPTLSHDEHKRIIEETIRIADKRVPVIAGTGSNNTLEAIEYTKHAEKAGADAALIVTPYYNKPTQLGLYEHYKTISESTSIPIIIYNIPGRSVIDMSVETMSRLFELKNIVGVKDATGDLERVNQSIKKMGNEFIQLTGNDENALEFNKRGGVGAISVTANIVPKLCSDFQKYSIEKDQKSQTEAKRLDEILQPIHNAMFIESNPSPVKYAAKILNLCDDDVRLPLVKITNPSKEIIKKVLQSANLI